MGDFSRQRRHGSGSAGLVPPRPGLVDLDVIHGSGSLPMMQPAWGGVVVVGLESAVDTLPYSGTGLFWPSARRRERQE